MATKQNMNPGREVTSGSVSINKETGETEFDKGGDVMGVGDTPLEVLGAQQEKQAQQTQPFEDLSGLDYQDPGITNEDRFYGARQPIQRGTSASGVPIFVANQALTPIGILDKKEAAIKEAERKRAERKSKFKLDEVERLKNANYQKAFDESFFEMQNKYINEAKTLYGDNWDVALGGSNTDLARRYQQELSNYKTLKSQSDAVTDKAAEIRARMEAGDTTVSERTAQAVEDIQNAIGEFSDGNPVDLEGKMNEMWASVNLDDKLNDTVFKNLKAIENKHSSGLMSDGEYQTQKLYHTKQIGEQADQIAERLKRTVFRFDPNIKEKDISDAIKQRIGNFTSSKTTVVDKPSKKKGPTDEEVNNRLYKVNTLKDPFKGGTLEQPTEEALSMVKSMVTGVHNGRVIKDAYIEKGGTNKEADNLAQTLINPYKEAGSDDLKDGFSEATEKIKGKEYTFTNADGTSTTGTVEGVSVDAGDAGAVLTIQVNKDGQTIGKKYNLSNESSYGEILEGLSDAYPNTSDRIVLEMEGANQKERKKISKGKKMYEYINLSDEGQGLVINSILNSATGEDLDIKNTRLEEASSGADGGKNEFVETNTTKKDAKETAKKDEKSVSSDDEIVLKEEDVQTAMKNNPKATRAQVEAALRNAILAKRKKK